MMKTLHRKIASIPLHQSALNFFMDVILICQDCSQYLTCPSISSVLLPIFYAVILSCIPISRHDHGLIFLNSCPNHTDFSIQLVLR
jgi:hypothetical protein